MTRQVVWSLPPLSEKRPFCCPEFCKHPHFCPSVFHCILSIHTHPVYLSLIHDLLPTCPPQISLKWISGEPLGQPTSLIPTAAFSSSLICLAPSLLLRCKGAFLCSVVRWVFGESPAVEQTFIEHHLCAMPAPLQVVQHLKMNLRASRPGRKMSPAEVASV